MSEKNPYYHNLEIEDSWTEYLRTRLPYCFMEISQVPPQGRPEHFELSGPEPLTGFQATERHNFWTRGNIYYMAGKLLDYYSMSQAGRHYRMQEAMKLWTGDHIARFSWPLDAFTFYNSIQMEKVWGFVQENHRDRERVMMTNVLLAVELCLKAVMTHANFNVSGSFKFSAGHDIVKLFKGLPDSLRDEIETESKVFAEEYASFRNDVETDVRKILDQSGAPQHLNQGPTEREAKAEWEKITDRIKTSSYTAFVNSNDPGTKMSEDWFEEALHQVRSVGDFHDISQYFRYAPQQDRDELPTDLIEHVLLLGRFLYEHLFPVPPPENHLPISGFPVGSK